MKNGSTTSTVSEWLRFYMDNIAKENIRYRTWNKYDGIIRIHLIPLLGHHVLTELEPEHIEAAYTVMRKTLSPASVLY